jgi:hypothetical protein
MHFSSHLKNIIGPIILIILTYIGFLLSLIALIGPSSSKFGSTNHPFLNTGSTHAYDLTLVATIFAFLTLFSSGACFLGGNIHAVVIGFVSVVPLLVSSILLAIASTLYSMKPVTRKKLIISGTVFLGVHLLFMCMFLITTGDKHMLL